MKTKSKISAALRKEVAFLESLARRCPQDVDVLKTLGDLYTRTGCYEDGLKTDLELARLCPRESLVWYNLACSYALTARTDEALSALVRAVDLGYRDAMWIRKDADLESIRKDRRFKALMQLLLISQNDAHRSE